MRRLRLDDRGSLAPAVPIIAIFLLVLGGLVVDGSRALDTKALARAYAEEAARAGASAIDLTSTDLRLIPSKADAQVATYCVALVKADPQVTSCAPAGIDDVAGIPLRIHARVSVRMQTTLLSIVGAEAFTFSYDATAQPEEGV